jgi:hypothetical protein
VFAVYSFYGCLKVGKKTVTLPKQYWDRLYSIASDIEGVISDALFMVVDLGFKALDNEDVMDLIGEEEGEKEEEEDEEEEDEEEEYEEEE